MIFNSLGPFLMQPSSTSMGFWFAFDPAAPLTGLPKIEVDIILNDKSVARAEILKRQDTGPYHIYTGVITGLTADTEYHYQVSFNSINFIPEGLVNADLTFRTLTVDSASDFVLMSCHGVEQWEKNHRGKSDRTWTMWTKLSHFLKVSPEIRMGILGGDQIYTDKTFNRRLIYWMRRMKFETIQDSFWAVYYKHWSHAEYRKVLARLPTFLMWDDHDIIDGWGTRSESRDWLLKNRWQKYGVHAEKAFYSFQSCRNDGRLSHLTHTFFFKQGRTAFLGMDLRTERDGTKGVMLSAEHKQQIEDKITKYEDEIDQCYILSPVTVTRMGDKMESFLGIVSNALWKILSPFGYQRSVVRVAIWFLLFLTSHVLSQHEIGETWIKTVSYQGSWVAAGLAAIGLAIMYGSKSASHGSFTYKALRWIGLIPIAAFFVALIWIGVPGERFTYRSFPQVIATIAAGFLYIVAVLEALGLIDEISSMRDDLKDTWSAKENVKELQWLANVLKRMSHKKIKATILSGDIHTAGMSRIYASETSATTDVVTQIVSSPITYPPMPSMVEKLTSGFEIEQLPKRSPVIRAQNIFYCCDRNFVVISTRESHSAARFIFESYIDEVKILF